VDTFTETKLSKIKDICVIISSILIPTILAFGGWYIQYSNNKDTIKEEYVKIASSILINDKTNKVDPDLRKWATDIFNKYAPIPLSKKLKNKLESEDFTGQFVYVPTFPSTPAFMTQECEEMEYLNGTDFTLDYFINITINNSVKYRDCSHLNHVKSLWIIKTKQNMESK
jgi:hypothetical protein